METNIDKKDKHEQFEKSFGLSQSFVIYYNTFIFKKDVVLPNGHIVLHLDTFECVFRD